MLFATWWNGDGFEQLNREEVPTSDYETYLDRYRMGCKMAGCALGVQ